MNEIERLSEAIARLEQRQQEILERLARLEAGAPRPARQPKPPRPPRQRARTFETRMGLMWVNRIGVVTLVLGAAFFFKYAVESGWIGVAARELIGAACGLTALALAERAWRAGRQVYGQGVSAAGLAILYLTCYAGFALYHVIGQPAAFALMAAVTAGAAVLAMRYASLALAALALFGGYITPLLLGSAPAWFALGYITLLNAGAVWLARVRRWRGLAALAIAGSTAVYASLPAAHGYTVFLLAWYGLFWLVDAVWSAAAAQVLASFAVALLWRDAVAPFFAAAVALAAAGVRRAPLAALGAFWLAYVAWHIGKQRPELLVFWLLAPAFLVFLEAGRRNLLLLALNAGAYVAAGYAALRTDYHNWLGLFAVVVAAVHFALAWLVWRRLARVGELAAGIGAALLVLAVPLQFEGYHITQIWALEGAALAWIGRRARYAAPAVFALVLARLLLFDYPRHEARLFTFALAAVCLWAAARWSRSGWIAGAEYVAGHFTLLWGLGLQIRDWAGPGAAPAWLSMLMAGYAVVLVTIGFAGGSAVNRALGLGLVALVVLKLYLYDVWRLALLYRMAAFAVLGVLLLAMSYLYSRTWRRNRT